MPRANWEVRASDVRKFDRSKQFTPYRGPLPPSGQVFAFLLKQLKYVPGTQEKNPQLRIGLELQPQRKEEKKYAGFFVMTFRSVTDKSQFAYVPFLDTIGVSESDFVDRTVTDAEGNITRIGGWRNDGKLVILAQVKDSDDGKGNTRKDVGWIGPLENDSDEYGDDELDEEIDDDGLDDDDIESNEEFEEEEEEVKPTHKARSSGRTSARRASVARGKRRQAEEDPF